MTQKEVSRRMGEIVDRSHCRDSGYATTVSAETLAVVNYLTANVYEKIEAQAIAETVKRDMPGLLGCEMWAEVGLAIRDWLTEDHRKELDEDKLNFVGGLAQIALQRVDWHQIGKAFDLWDTNTDFYTASFSRTYPELSNLTAEEHERHCRLLLEQARDQCASVAAEVNNLLTFLFNYEKIQKHDLCKTRPDPRWREIGEHVGALDTATMRMTEILVKACHRDG